MDSEHISQLSASIDKQNYTCTVQDSRHMYIIDEPESKGGANVGPDPLSALLASLASCIAITLKMYADKKEIDTGKINVHVELRQSGSGKSTKSTFLRKIQVENTIEEEQIERLNFIASVCPVSRLLSGEIEIKTIDQDGQTDS
jgi:putative redox protein